MTELYLISILASLGTFFAILWFVCAFIGVFGYCWAIGEDCDEAVKIKKCSKRFLIVAVLSGIISVLIPSKKDMYIIYGVGSTIDYLKSNDKTKQLPDKVINALDKWVEDTKDTNKEN